MGEAISAYACYWVCYLLWEEKSTSFQDFDQVHYREFLGVASAYLGFTYDVSNVLRISVDEVVYFIYLTSNGWKLMLQSV